MVLPLLFSFGLPALAASSSGGVLAGLSAPMLAGLGAGIGSFLQTGDVGKGLQTGLTGFLGGKLLGGLGGGLGAGAAAKGSTALTTASPMSAVMAAEAPKSFLTPMLGETMTKTMSAPGLLEAALIGSSAASGLNRKEPEKKESDPPPDPKPKIKVQKKKPKGFKGEFSYFDYYDPEDYPNARIGMSMGGILGGGATHPMFMGLGQNIARALSEEQSKKVQPFIQKVEQDAKAEFGDEIFNMPQMQGGKGQGLGLLGAAQRQASQIAARPFQDVREYATTPELTGPKNFLTVHPDSPNAPMAEPIRERPPNPFMAALGGVSRFQSALGMAEGGEVEADDMREDQLILNSIRAVKGELSIEDARMILGEFLKEYGKEALEDLITKTKSGEYDDTVARFARGEQGMVRGPGDGSGEDDKVPATLEGTQPVLLTEDEFVIRQPTQEALTKAFGGGFLDKVNQAEEDAPKVLKKMVG
jgi:hypothetical protein